MEFSREILVDVGYIGTFNGMLVFGDVRLGLTTFQILYLHILFYTFYKFVRTFLFVIIFSSSFYLYIVYKYIYYFIHVYLYEMIR